MQQVTVRKLQLDLLKAQAAELCLEQQLEQELSPGHDDPLPSGILRSLEASHAAQHLSLGPSIAHADEGDADPEFEGSGDHLLGITPRALLAAHGDTTEPAQESLQEWAPELSAALEQRCSWLAEAVCTSGGSGNDPADLTTAVQQLSGALEAAEQSRDAAEERFVSEAEALTDVHRQLHDTEERVAEAYVQALQCQQASDEKEFALAHSMHQQHLAAVTQMESQLLADTYSSESSKALMQILRHLEDAAAAKSSQIKQVSDKIIARENLGPEYMQLAKQYGAARQLIHDLKRMA
ncbi:hypothetical protein WJX73_003203 [Symbiochloris irregularis]|uniref:Uncharacterized protein n=1 Tax=Symbiochloris irregularis TaxID=706552 RepID=A0AAW1NTK4_9CHLO